MNKKITAVAYISMWAVTVAIGTYFRLYPLRSFVPSDISEKATMFVLTQLRDHIARETSLQYPNHPQTQKDILVDERFNRLLRQDREKINRTIETAKKNINAGQDSDRKIPYLLASDSFYYYGLTENILKKNKLGGPVKGSKYLNELMLAPFGHWEPYTLHPYTGYALFKWFSFFDPKITLMHTVSFVPILLTALALIPFLFICYTLRVSLASGFISCLFLNLAPIFIKRSAFGWYDNDPYNILFPLLILSLLLFGLSHLHNKKSTTVTGCMIALLILLYAMFWQGWVLLFAVIFVAALLIWIYNRFIRRDNTAARQTTILFGLVFSGGLLTISLAFGVKEFFILFQEGWAALKNFLKPQLSPWPDMYITVGELHRSSLSFMIKQVGGPVFFYGALWGAFSSIILSIKNPKKNSPPQIILLSTMLAATLFISWGAQRFLLLCVTPLSIFFALGIHNAKAFICRSVERIPNSFNQLRGKTPYVLSILVLALGIWPIRHINTSIASILNPIYNDTWERTLTQIRDKTPPNAIINAWWPPGHFIKAVAKRRVTFDGATINYPQAYWIANVFLAEDEAKALGILRMLNTSANRSAEYMQNLGFPLSLTVLMLEDLVAGNKGSARTKLLKANFQPEEADELLRLTHQKPPASYLLIFNEFVEKNLQLSYVGRWNFKAIEAINKDPGRIAKIPDPSSEKYIPFIWNLIGGAHKYSGRLGQVSRQGDTVLFKDNVTVDVKKLTCRVASNQYGTGVPLSIFYSNGHEFKEKKLPDANLAYSVMLVPNNGKYSAVLLDRELARSMLMRLFFFDGAGLKYFKPFLREKDLSGRTEIAVFAIDWNQFIDDLNGN